MMPRNTGTMPKHPLVDLRLRNGSIHRGQKPSNWRWKTWGWDSPFDIVTYQEAR